MGDWGRLGFEVQGFKVWGFRVSVEGLGLRGGCVWGGGG